MPTKRFEDTIVLRGPQDQWKKFHGILVLLDEIKPFFFVEETTQSAPDDKEVVHHEPFIPDWAGQRMTNLLLSQDPEEGQSLVHYLTASAMGDIMQRHIAVNDLLS